MIGLFGDKVSSQRHNRAGGPRVIDALTDATLFRLGVDAFGYCLLETLFRVCRL